MNPRTPFLTASIACAAPLAALAQYTAPVADGQPFPGFINQLLRDENPAAAAWDFGGSLRLRYEVREGNLSAPPSLDLKANAANDNHFFSDKLLVHGGYRDTWWGVWAEGRSSSATGDLRGSAANIPTGSSLDSDGPMDIQQAYLLLGDPHQFPVTLKAGRQELSYGDERLIGSLGWTGTGRTFDAAKIRWSGETFQVDGFTARPVVPVDNHFNMSGDYEYFSGLYLTTSVVPHNQTELYLLARNVGPQEASLFAPAVTPAPYNTSARDVYTLGGRLLNGTNALHNFDYTLEGAWQFGDWKRAANAAVRPNQRDEHRAFAFVANAGYTFAEEWAKPRLALEYSFASGDRNPNDGTHGTFDTLYPTGHKFSGYMNLASWENIHDLRAILTVHPVSRWTVSVEGHGLWLADTADTFYNVGAVARSGGAPGSGTAYGLNPGYSPFLGTELDVITGYALTRFAGLEAGYGHFFRGGYIDQTFSKSGSRDADWIYLQTTLRF